MRKFSACLIPFKKSWLGVCFSILGLSLLVSTFIPLKVLAHTDYQLEDFSEGQINDALTKTVPLRFLPSHPLYFLINVKEIISRFFQPSSVQRARFDFILLGKRLKETYMMLEKGDVKRASKNLERYRQRSASLIKQMEKARAQNQSTVAFADETAEGLKLHEILLSAINQKWQNHQEGYNFDDNFQGAVDAFVKTVLAIDNVKPGLKNRFKTATSSATLETESSVSPSPTPQILILETSPSAKPRRIIY